MADAPGSIFEKLMSENPDVQQRGQEAQALTGIDLSSYFKKQEKLPELNPERPTVLDHVPSLSELKEPIDSDLMGGNALTGPNALKTTDAFINKLQNAPVENPYQWGKPYTFNTGVNNADFDRYYTHPNYSKLGYSPFRDNETLYNDKSSWSDDFNRMRKQWMGLAWEGVKSMWGSSDSEEFDRRNRIGSSSKGGFGGFATNLLLNTSYTVGVATDLIAEELALAGATAATGGFSSEVTIPEMAAELARAGTKIGHGVEALTETKKILNSAEQGRNFWNATKSGRMATDAADFLNPLRYTTRAIYGMSKEAKGYKGLTSLAKASTTTGAFLRDLTRIRAAYGESKLEGDNVQTKLTDDLIGEFYKKNGRMPEGIEADKIFDLAKEGSFKTQLYNVPLLMITNDMVFGKAFRGFQPKWLEAAERAGGLPGEVIENVDWKKTGAKAFEAAPEGYKKFLVPNYWKQAPSKVILGTLAYGKANFFEGAQETMQDMISGSIDDYYKKIYHDPLLAGAKQQWASFKNGTAAQLSGQGFETFLSGFLMGGVLQIPQNAIMGYVPRIQMGKSAYEEHRAAVQKQTAAVIDAMNDVVMNTGKYTTAIEENAIQQKNLSKDMQNTESINDRKGYQDAKNQAMFTHIRTLLEHGQYDVFHDALKGMQDWTDQELAEAFNVRADDVAGNKNIRQRLEDTIRESEGIKKRYEGLSHRFTNPYNPDIYDKKTQPAQWLATAARKQAFEDVKFHAIYGNYAFEKTLDRMKSILDNLGGVQKPLKNALTVDITALLDPNQHKERRKSIADEISAYDQGDASQKKQAAKLSKQLEAMDALGEKLAEYSDMVDQIRNPLPGKELDSQKSFNITREVKDAYFKYIKVLAKNNDETVLDEHIYPSLNSLFDYLELDKDHKSMAQFVNFMHNPKHFMTTVERRFEELNKLEKQRAEVMANALEEFIAMKDQNQGVFNAIFNEGAFMTSESVDALKAGNYDNLKFYNADAPYGPVDPASAKYQKIMEIIRAYQKTHTQPSEEPAPEAPAPGEATPEVSVPEKVEGAGQIIYATMGTGKTPLAEKQPDKYVDGDIILLNHLKSLAEEFNTPGNEVVRVPANAQDAGLAFTEFLNTQTPADRKTAIAEIKQAFKDIAASGKNILTASWFARDIADKVYLRKDAESLMEELRKRGRVNVKTEAQAVLDKEAAAFANREVQEIPKGMSIEDMLEGGKPAVEEGHASMLEKINNLNTMDAVKEFEDGIVKKLIEDDEYLERYGFTGGDIAELLNNRKEQIAKTVTFATVSKGNYIVMKDGSLVHVRAKLKNGNLRVMIQGQSKESIMTPADLKNADRIVTKENVKELAKMTPEDKSAADQNMKNTKEFLSDPDARKKALDEAKNKSKGDADTDLLNTICT